LLRLSLEGPPMPGRRHLPGAHEAIGSGEPASGADGEPAKAEQVAAGVLAGRHHAPPD